MNVLIKARKGYLNLAHVEQLTIAPIDGTRCAVVAWRASNAVIPLTISEHADQDAAAAALEELVARIELAGAGPELVGVVRGVGT